MSKIEINFPAGTVISEPCFKNGESFINVIIKDVNPQDIYIALDEDYGIDIDEFAEVIGKDRILEWANDNTPHDELDSLANQRRDPF